MGSGRRRPDAAHGADPVVVVAQDLGRCRQPMKLDAFLLGVVDFLDPCRALGLGPAIDAIYLFGAQAQRHAHRVHRRVTGPDDRDTPPQVQGGVVIRETARLHQVAARQQLVG